MPDGLQIAGLALAESTQRDLTEHDTKFRSFVASDSAFWSIM